ncbi:MAG: winged helix-turn-helix domain-containing protein [Pyrinomonadaceae bacterium]|nr:winged helix-turn-helix domain-containing protein [Pyrinomonadaceae bacterium]
MAEQECHFYEFGRFRLDARERVLLRDRDLVPLTPKVFEILLALVEQSGHVVEKDDLMKRVWPDTFVEDGNLTQNVSLLRKALGETTGGVQFIETISRRGYRFVATVREATENGNHAVTSNDFDLRNKGNEFEVGPVGRSAEAPSSVKADSNGPGSPSAHTAWGGGAAPNGVGQVKAPVTSRAPFVSTSFGKQALALALGIVLVALISVVYFTGRGKAGDAGAGPIASIAVLPFSDEAASADTEYLNDKIAESLINSLSKLPKLRVVPRSLVANYKGQNIDPRAVGRELNVRAVVTGRVRRHGDTISIQADLIDLEKVAQIWGQLYDRKLADILIVQDDIARNIFENLRLRLNVEEKKQLEAYRLYLKGRNSWNKRTASELQQGIQYFQQAIDTDPNYAPAYAGLADCHNMLVVYGASQPKEGFPKAKEAAIKALEIDESLAEAHTSLAFINFRWDRDRVEAERGFREAIKLQPSYAPAHQWYSSYLVALERFDEAIAEATRTQDLEPLSSTASAHLGWILYLAGQNDRGIEQGTKIMELDPNAFPALRYRGLAYEQKGMYREAIGDFQKGVKLSGSPLMLALLGHAYAASGQKAAAKNVLNELRDLQGRRYVSPYTIAAIYAGLGEKDQAFKWLDKAEEERDIWLMNLKVDPVFRTLRSDPRFPDLLVRTRLRP